MKITNITRYVTLEINFCLYYVIYNVLFLFYYTNEMNTSKNNFLYAQRKLMHLLQFNFPFNTISEQIS